MTLTELAVTIVVLGSLGLVARRFGLSAIPAYLLAGILLGPNEPREIALISPSEVTDFLAELGLVFLLFFLGLEFSLSRLRSTGRHIGLGGTVDLVANFGLGLVVGVIAFGWSFAALILAACIYVSSSAIAVKGLIDFRRLGDDETDLVLAILVFEDLIVAFMLGFSAAGGGGRRTRSSSSPRRSGSSRPGSQPRGGLLALSTVRSTGCRSSSSCSRCSDSSSDPPRLPTSSASPRRSAP